MSQELEQTTSETYIPSLGNTILPNDYSPRLVEARVPSPAEQLVQEALAVFENHKHQLTFVDPKTKRQKLTQKAKDLSQHTIDGLLACLPEENITSLKQTISNAMANSAASRLFRQSLRGKADWQEKTAFYQVLEHHFPEEFYRTHEYQRIGKLSGAARFSHELKLATQRAEQKLGYAVETTPEISRFEQALAEEADIYDHKAEALAAETQPEPEPQAKGFLARVRQGWNRVRRETTRQWNKFKENVQEQGVARTVTPLAKRLGYAAITGITIGLALGGLGGLALALHQDIRRNQALARDRSRPAVAVGGVVPGIVTQPKTMERTVVVKHAVAPQVASTQRQPEAVRPTPITRKQQPTHPTPTPVRAGKTIPATDHTPEPTPASLPVAGASEQKSSDLAAVPPPAVNISAEVEAPQPTYGQQVLSSIPDGAMLELPTGISHHNDACEGDNFCAPVQLVKPNPDGTLPDFFRDGVAGNSHIAPLYRLPQGDLVAYPHNLENHPEFLVLGVLSVNLESLEIGNTVKLAGYEFRIIAKNYVDPNAGFSAVTNIAVEYYGGRLFLFGCSKGGSLSADRVVITAIPVELQK